MSNRLARETSPYLLQHAENPVDWYPWGEEARTRAQRDDRPILLSIGYSSCHWCHVMERESFEDPETARVMNDGFVNVKVDREERPDVDGVYMRAVQALTGHGGWPLTVFLTPSGEPFYGGTYFPPEPRHGMPSFRQVLEATLKAWEERRDEVEGAAGRIRDLLERSTRVPEAEEREEEPALDDTLSARAAAHLLRQFDPRHGGFGSAPKFPQPVVLDFLLEHHALTGDQPALEAVLHTLRQMGRGGIRDHLGGGFHRYSVDARWLVPHFEKMLYDNALLAGTYLRGYQLTGDPWLERVCREILEDLLEDFRSPEGAFYTARDADSEGEEGRYYVWTPAQLDEVLSPDRARLVRRCYDVSEEGNFEGRSILHLPHDLEAVARDEGMSLEALEEALAEARAALKEARAAREPPLRDEKILAGWNALAIRAFSEAGAVLDEPRYVDAADRAARWLLDALRPEGRLLHQVPETEARIPGFLDDVAGMGNALLSLHEATLDPRWLEEVVELDREVEDRFRDPDTGLLHDTPGDGERLVVRPREPMDNPIPSGTSLAAELRQRLGRVLGEDDRLDAARRIVETEAATIVRLPSGFGRLLAVGTRLVHPSIEIALLVPSDGEADVRPLLREAHRPLLPGRAITGGAPGVGAAAEGPLLRDREPVDDRATAFVCSGYTCREPITDARELRAELERVSRSSP